MLVRSMFVICLAFALGGCAVAVDSLTGQVVFGWDMGEVAETVEQVAVEAGGAVLGGLGVPAAIAGPVALLGGILFRVTKKAALLEGNAQGWDEREKAGAAQQPLPNAPPQTGAN